MVPRMNDSSQNLRQTFTHRGLWLAMLAGLAVRTAIALTMDPGFQTGMQRWYLVGTATLASGYGLKMPSARTSPSFGTEELPRPEDFMQQREQEGGRIDPEHPYPPDVSGWIEGTHHPAGYTVFLYALYRVGNYTGMIILSRVLQIILDVTVCALIAVFATLLFDRRVAIVAAWAYALCPPAFYLSTSLLPDAFHGFLTASILTATVLTRRKLPGMWIVAGLMLGIACHLRSEYVLMPVALYVILVLERCSLWKPIPWLAGAVVVMLIVLSPWAMYMKSATGRYRLNATVGGGNLYLGLGEEPRNPWGIGLSDAWLAKDAVTRGFESPWDAQANDTYFALFKQHVRERPGLYAKIVLLHRLPMALVPPHMLGHTASSEEFRFTKYRLEEGLTKWQVLRKYPDRLIKHKWRELVMMGYSAVLLACFVATGVLLRRDLRRYAWLALPWALTVGSMALFKHIEPRNMAPILFVQLTAFAFCAVRWWERRARRTV